MKDNNGHGQDFVEALDARWDNYRRQFKAVRQEITEDSIHDLRVAARRLQSFLRVLRELDRHGHTKKIWRFLQQQLDQLNGLRDAQVMLQEAGERMQSLPQLSRFRDYLQDRSDELTSAARKQIRAVKPSDLKRQVTRIRKVTRKHAGDEQLPENLLRAVDNAHAKATEAFGHLNATDPATIHHVRIAFKKFRYTVEIIQPLLEDYPEKYLDRMHEYQEAMGCVRDTNLFLSTLVDFKNSLTPSEQAANESPELQPIETYYQNRLDDLIRAYFERKDDFNTFWRAAPDQPFPWEQNHEPVHRTARNRRTTGQRQQRRRRQPSAANRTGAQKVPADRQDIERSGDTDRPDSEQSVPASS